MRRKEDVLGKSDLESDLFKVLHDALNDGKNFDDKNLINKSFCNKIHSKQFVNEIILISLHRFTFPKAISTFTLIITFISIYFHRFSFSTWTFSLRVQRAKKKKTLD